MPDAHALLAPSAAKRWMTCTPSARVESLLPEQTSTYAREGTLAHATAECLLHFYLGTQQIAVYDSALEHLQEFEAAVPALSDIRKACLAEGFDFEEILMTVHANYVYLVWSDYVRAKAEDPTAQLFVEQRVDMGDFVPESFGSSDAILVWDDMMNVYDLKYGRGVRVSAKGNPQMRLYALGAMVGPAEMYPVEEIRTVIVQPRLHAVSSDIFTTSDLVQWVEDVLKPKARLAWAGEGDFVPGDHCEFCRAKGTCKALAEYTDRIVSTSPEADAMTPDDLARVLGKLQTIETWIAGVRARATETIQRGGKVPGWKLVEGRSVRRIRREDEAREVLRQAGFRPSDYDKTELRGITDLTRLVGGTKVFDALLGALVERQPGKPALAPEDDPRADYSPAASAEAVFGGEL